MKLLLRTPTFTFLNRVINVKQKRGASLNDIKLILKCQKGEKEAFNELITKYYPYVSKFLIKLTINEELAQDLVQETFLKVITNIDKFDTKGSAKFSTYLMKIAKNTYLDYLKKDKKISYSLDLEEISDSGFEDKVADEEELNILLKEIDKLPYEQAQAIKLKYLEEYSLKEIADKMETQTKTIKSRIYEGKEKIKRKLKNGGILHE